MARVARYRSGMGWRQWFGGNAHTTDDLIAEAEAVRAASQPHKQPRTTQAAKPAGAPGPADTTAQIAELVRRGKKIEAVKLYRDTHGTGLKESKDAVETIAAGGPSASTTSAHAPASDARVLQYIDEGKLILAIKEYRTLHGTGLAESKDAVDRIAAQRAHGKTQA